MYLYRSHCSNSSFGRWRVVGRVLAGFVLLIAALAGPAVALVPVPDPIPAERAAPSPPEVERMLPSPTPSSTPVPIGGLSFSVARRSQKTLLSRQTVAGVPVEGARASNDSTSYLLGLDLYAGGCNLPTTLTRPNCSDLDLDAPFVLGVLQGAVGYTDGSTDVGGMAASADGPALDVGGQLLFGTRTFAKESARPYRFFLAGNFDFSNVSLEGVSGWSSAYRVEPNLGIIVDYRLYLYTGAAWEYLTPAQSTSVVLEGARLPVRFRVREENPWSAVLGMIYRDALGAVGIPGVDVVLEGDIGGRTQFLFTLRYELKYAG